MSDRNNLNIKLISIVASLALVVGLIPLSAFAEASDGAEEASAEAAATQRLTVATNEPARTTEEVVEVADANLDASVHHVPEGAAEDLQVMLSVKPLDYSVRFDANVPTNASTACSGTTENQSFAYAENKALSENGYFLPGYDFNGWNTKADGTGTAYANRAEVQSLTDDGSVVVLYAQWSAKPYAIEYWSDDAGSQKRIQTAYFDQSGKLNQYSDTAFGWNSSGMKLHGWAGTGYESFLKDGDDFCNLCGAPDANGNVTKAVLIANWVQNGQIVVAVTKDGAPQEGLANYLELAQGSETIPVPVVYQNGKYVFDPISVPTSGGSVAQLSPGEYDIRFGTFGYPQVSARITYGEDHAVSVVFDYYTVSLTKDLAHADFNEVEIIGGEGNTVIARDGDMLGIKTILAQGYQFVYYSAVGVVPIWERSDPSLVNQAIEVQGTVTISAHVKPIEYTIAFVNDDGTELQSGKVAYGETPKYTGVTPEKHATAQYTYTFAGWTPEIVPVTGAATFTAIYTKTVNKYTVKFVNEDGTELQSSEVEYGKTPTYAGETPTKIADEKHVYEFAGWTPEIKPVTGDVTYKATYTAKWQYACGEGSSSMWTKGSTDSLTFTFKRADDDGVTFDHFKGVEVDGKLVPEKEASGKANWTAKKGSLILSLQPEYLETLADGDHTVKALFDDGAGEATFKVTPKAVPASDKESESRVTPSTSAATSDTLPLTTVIAALLLSSITLVVSRRKLRVVNLTKQGKHAR